jgi:hypothetical protein
MIREREDKPAEGAVSVLPPGVSLLEEIVCHRLDDFGRCPARDGDGQVLENRLTYLDRCRRQDNFFVGRVELHYRLDLAGVAATVEFDDNGGDPR